MHERRSLLPRSEPTGTGSLVKQIWQQAQQAGSDLGGLLFPSRCASCGQVDEVLCPTCRDGFIPVQGPFCSRCGRPVELETELCEYCQRREPPYLACRSVFRFEGTLRAAVHAFKFERRTELSPLLVEAMLANVDRTQLERGGEPLDAVLPLPLHLSRRAVRGYNQAMLLAEPLAAVWGLPLLDGAVWRKRDTRTQLGLNARERRQNVEDAFEADPAQVSGLNVLLVDDVRTTGATLEACSAALVAAGASSVRALTLAQAVLSD